MVGSLHTRANRSASAASAARATASACPYPTAVTASTPVVVREGSPYYSNE